MSEKNCSCFKVMEGGCNLATASSGNHALAKACCRQTDLEEKLSECLRKMHQQGAFSGGINLISNEILADRLACGVKGPCKDSRHGTRDKLSVKYTTASQTVPQNDRHVYRCSEEPVTELLQGVPTKTELKKDEGGMCTLGPKALDAVSLHARPDTNLGLVDINPSTTFHLPHRCCVHPKVTSAVVKVTHKPSRPAFTNKPREKDLRAQQLDFSEPLKEKLQQKELENQQIAQLLLMKHQELRDVKEMLKLKEVEAQLMAEKLKCEEQKNFEVMEKLNNVCEEMKKKLCVAKSNNENFAKQLKALLEKYERLKKRASTIKGQLLEERTKKTRSQKTVKELQKMAEEVLMNQAVLEKQKEAATRELAASKKNLEKEQRKHMRNVQRVEEEKSVIRAEYEDRRDELCKTQEENKKLAEAVQSKELEKRRAEEDLLESQHAVQQLYAELDESKTQRESVHQQLETMKKEMQLIHNRHKVERLQLQEQNQTCVKQTEDKRIECEALKEVVSKLKKDKHLLREELECHRKEKVKYEIASKREGQRLREAVGLLERERELLLEEMKDLRKDYFSLSDRITQRLGQLDQPDGPMRITDISSFHQTRASKVDNTTVPVMPSMDMIQHIRRKLEEEENVQQK